MGQKYFLSEYGVRNRFNKVKDLQRLFDEARYFRLRLKDLENESIYEAVSVNIHKYSSNNTHVYFIIHLWRPLNKF